MSFAEVCVSLPAGRRQLFTYSIPSGLDVVPGSGVWAPFGARITQGVVVELTEFAAVEGVRPLAGLIQEEPILTSTQLAAACWLADYYFAPLFEAIALFLPPGFVRQTMLRISLTERGACIETDLVPSSLEAARLLKERGALTMKALEESLGEGAARRAAADLLKRGYATKTFEVAPPRVRPKTELYVSLSPAVHGMLPVLSSRREALINYLRRQPGAVTLAELKGAGFSRELVNALVKTGAVITEAQVITRRPFISGGTEQAIPFELTSYQQHAVATINKSLLSGHTDTFLLHGVTGAGKTEVYLQTLLHAVRSGKQGIVLVPEIALTPQTAERFAARFPGKTAVLHSGLSLGEQHDTWWDIKRGAYDVVIGARSALFAPLPRMGLIVLDEEHEWTYKQDDRVPHYHARTAALKIAQLNGATVVLGSATPDTESYYRAQAGIYRLLELPERLTPRPGALMPDVEVVDLRAELKTGNRSIFSLALVDRMRRALAAREQVILFLNRRGTAWSVQCRTCGNTVVCSSCRIAFSYHDEEESLLCHQCGRRRLVPRECPKCSSRRIRFLGIGTQKVMEEAASLFPEARLLRWDSDAARGKDAHAGILARMRRHEADVLVGTQLVAKGLDLPLVTIVGVVSADTALGLPDFRAGERTFQLISQVAGRSGRGERPGRAIIQTYAPEHYAVQAAAAHDYRGFYRREIEYRRMLGVPPFSQLVRLSFAQTKEKVCLREAEDLKARLLAEIQTRGLSVTVIGPAPAFVARARGRYRWQLILKGNNSTEVLRGIDLPRGWIVDVDPVGV